MDFLNSMRRCGLGLAMLLVAVAGAVAPAQAQTAPAFDRVEYFFDTDPGFGQGTAVALPGAPGTTLAALPFTADLAPLSAGFHTLFVRSRAGANNWSQTYRQILYKEPAATSIAPPANLAAVEYFVDTDPGYGQGSSAAISGGSTNATGVAFSLSLGAVPAGFHTLYYRVRDAANKWSQTHSRLFYVDDPAVAAVPNLNKAEYYVDTDPGYGAGTDVPIATPAATLPSLNLLADLSGLPDGPHRIFVRVRDANNRWSMVLNRPFAKSGCSSSPNHAALLPAASYTGSGLTPAAVEQLYNGLAVTGSSSTFQNNFYAQVDLGTALRPVSEVQLSLQNVNGTAVNYTLQVETSANLSSWSVIDSYSATLAANQTAPVRVARTFATVLSNVRGLRLRLLLPTVAQGIQLTDAGVFYFNCVGPTVTGFTPTSGPAGTAVTITGTNLTGATLVRFNGTAAGAITNSTATSLTVAAPAGGSNGPICVTTPDGTACSTGSYTYPPAIATGTVSPATFCAGSGISVPFSTNTADYAAGNAFGLQLSDASGVFAANAPVFGTLSGALSANGGTLAGTIPNTTPAGTGYRVRVVASNPAVTGADNATSLAINATPVSQAAGPATVANGAPIALTVSPTYPGATYSWSAPTVGAFSTQQSPTTSTATPGVTRYSVTVTLGSCSFSSFVDVTVQASTDPILTLTAFSQGFCQATPRILSYTVSGNRYPVGNVVTAQLSDATGGFANPTAIGSFPASGMGSGALSVTVPATTPPGIGYRVRLVSSNPVVISNDNGSNLAVNAPPTATATSNSPVPQSGTIELLGGPAVAGNTYSWSAQYTSGGGAFVSSAQNPQLANATPGQSGNYTLTITNAAGCSATASVAVTVTPSVPVTTLALTPLAGPLCAGSGYTLSYTAGGPSFNAGNTISAVLSDASGMFSAASPVIGALSTTAAAAGTLGVTIPAATVAGGGYRIRLVSSDPVIVSSDNGSSLTINNLSVAAAGSNSPVAAGSSITLTATGIAGATYAWTGPNGYTATGPNQTIGNATAANAGTYSVTIGLSGCSATASTTVVVSAAPNVASIQTSAITGAYCAGTAISVPFTAANFTAGNVFTAELSNASGSFGSPVSLGTLAGTSGGTIAGVLPAATAAGTGYRIRVVGSQPATVGSDNGSNLTVTAAGLFTWLGNVSTSWFEPANWSCGQVPTGASSVMIPAGMALYPVLGAGTPAALNLTVATGASLTFNGTFSLLGNLLNNGTLNAGTGSFVCAGTTAQTLGGSNALRFFNLTVNNAAGVTLQTPLALRRVLTLAAGNLASGGYLTLESDATGTAMVVNPAGGGIVTGLATAQRYVDGSRNPGLGYRHFASPVAGPTATVADLHGPGAPAPTVNLAYNAAANPFVVTPFPTAYTYNEQRLTAAGNSTFDFGWESPALTDALRAGVGYSVNLAPTTLSLTGTLRTGSQPVALSAGPTANSGWQLLGNPYPAPLNWDNLARPAGMDDALYVFQSSGPYAGSYVAYVGGIGPVGANLVASGQGFFGRVSNGSPTLTFTNAARETAYSSPVQQRNTAETRPLLELALRGPAANGPADVLYVYQEAGATAGFDGRYDALKVVLNGGQQPTLYQQAGAHSLSIQGLPTGGQPQVLPLGVNAPSAGTFFFAPQRLDNFPPVASLFLEDRQTGTWHNLRTGAYAAALAPGLSTARFVLHLNHAQGPLTATPGRQPFAEMQVYPNPAALRAAVQVVVSGQAAALVKARLDVLNSIGQRVYSAPAPSVDLAGRLRVVVPTDGLAAGVYTVRLVTATGVLTHKLLIN